MKLLIPEQEHEEEAKWALVKAAVEHLIDVTLDWRNDSAGLALIVALLRDEHARRFARDPSAEGYRKQPIPFKLRWEVFKRDDFRCQRCGSRDDLHADHIVPESAGGEATMGNLQTLCRACNCSKGTGE